MVLDLRPPGTYWVVELAARLAANGPELSLLRETRSAKCIPWNADRKTLRPAVEANVLGNVERNNNDVDIVVKRTVNRRSVEAGARMILITQRQTEPITWLRSQPTCRSLFRLLYCQKKTLCPLRSRQLATKYVITPLPYFCRQFTTYLHYCTTMA